MDGLIKSEYSTRPDKTEQIPLKENEKNLSELKCNGRILIVDDEQVNLIMVSKVFTSHHYTVVQAKSGYEALDIIEKDNAFDLIVLDIMMPGLTGIEVCVKIRKNFALFEMPILILTAYSDIDAVVDVLEKGANDFISKPFNPEEMMARSKNLISLKRLTNSNTVLNDALNLKDQLINMAVHDIKNPLMGIKQFSRMMMVDLPDEDPNKKYLKEIELASSGVLDQVIELLELSKIESGKMPMNKMKVDLYSILLEVILRYKGLADNKDQQIILDIDKTEDFFVYGDRRYLFQIMDNMVSNAVKYSFRSTEIKVSMGIKNNLNNPFIVISVKDCGPGLSKHDLSLLFQKYQKLTPKPTGGESSTGLGLSIAYKLAELHNAHFYAESVLGEGTNFFFEIPVIKQNSSTNYET